MASHIITAPNQLRTLPTLHMMDVSGPWTVTQSGCQIKRTEWEEASTITTYESWLEMGAPSGKWSVMKNGH